MTDPRSLERTVAIDILVARHLSAGQVMDLAGLKFDSSRKANIDSFQRKVKAMNPETEVLDGLRDCGPGNPDHIAKVFEIVALQQSTIDPNASTVPRISLMMAIGGKKWSEWRRNLSTPLNLCGADFSGVPLRGIDFSNALMRNVRLDRCKIFFCEFQDADLRGARFVKVQSLSGLTLNGADLTGADFSGAKLVCPTADNRTKFGGAKFSGYSLKPLKGGSGKEEVEQFKRFLSEEQRKQLAGFWRKLFSW